MTTVAADASGTLRLSTTLEPWTLLLVREIS